MRVTIRIFLVYTYTKTVVPRSCFIDMYIYTHTYIHKYFHTCAYMHICIHVYTCINLHTYTYEYTYLCTSQLRWWRRRPGVKARRARRRQRDVTHIRTMTIRRGALTQMQCACAEKKTRSDPWHDSFMCVWCAFSVWVTWLIRAHCMPLMQCACEDDVWRCHIYIRIFWDICRVFPLWIQGSLGRYIGIFWYTYEDSFDICVALFWCTCSA